tara:strand:- start:1232 stop:1471 length:240 start_codon:yes stop_codon:yes gene_type:complete
MNTFRQSSNAGFLTAKDSQQHLKIQLLKIQNFIRGLELETTLNLLNPSKQDILHVRSKKKRLKKDNEVDYDCVYFQIDP